MDARLKIFVEYFQTNKYNLSTCRQKIPQTGQTFILRNMTPMERTLTGWWWSGRLGICRIATGTAEASWFTPAQAWCKVTAKQGVWVVPQHRGVWIPARVEHQIESAGPFSMRSVYARDESAAELPISCRVVGVTPT